MNPRQPILLFLGLALPLASPIPASAAPPVTASPDPGALAKVLSDRALFGKDLPAVLMVLGGFRKAGETRLAIFGERVTGERIYERTAEAKKAEEELGIETLEPPRPVKPEFAALAKSAPKVLLKTQVIAKFPDDDSIRVALGAKQIQLLKPGLKIAEVVKRLGAPERTEDVAVQTRSERRPVVLRLSRYLGGAIVFAESDHAQKAGFVDRVLVDLPVVEAALFAATEGEKK